MRRTDGVETWDAVYEVYYNEDGSISGWTENPAAPMFHHEIDSGDLRAEIGRFFLACDLPVLDWATGKEIK